MRIVAWDPSDRDMTLACYEVFLAAHAVDEPIEPPPSAGTFRYLLAHGHESNPGEVWVVPGTDAGGRAVAYCRLDLPDLEDKDRAFLHPVVHPAVRRRGIGRGLLRHAASRAAACGRSVIDGETLAGSAGEGFARRVGATLSLTEVRRVQDVRKLAPGRVAELRAAAARAAAGYRLVTWTGPVPDEYAGQVADVYNAFNDAPRGEGHDDEVWDAGRITERASGLLREGHMRGYTVAAVAADSGEMAAITQMVVDPEHPEWAYQQLTAVTRPHRGHRLGLLVKTAMLDLLAEAEPKVERIATGNAAGNEHMIAVNETLGYEVTEPGYQFYEIPVTAIG